jgi:Sulfotransferase domain
VLAIRRVALGWGMLTAPARMLPDVIIVGAQRSGTTTLFRMLSEHPQVSRPTLSKGMAFFDLRYERGMRWYRAHFPLRLLAWLRTPGRRRLTFESSGYYMFHPHAAARMAQALPHVRVVALLRNPVDRAYSAHRHELSRGFETLDFEEALAHEDERLRGEEERLQADPSAYSFEHQHHAYLARSRYVGQVRRLLDTFGPDRVLVMDAEALFADPRGEFTRLCEWLGIDPPVEVADEQWNAEPRDPLSPERRAELTAYFAPYDEELAALLGRPLSWRSAGQSPGSS